jgi:hypothetical protein
MGRRFTIDSEQNLRPFFCNTASPNSQLKGNSAMSDMKQRLKAEQKVIGEIKASLSWLQDHTGSPAVIAALIKANALLSEAKAELENAYATIS